MSSMKELYKELWGKPANLIFTEYEISVPQPEVNIEPEYCVQIPGEPASSIQLTGISTRTIRKTFTKVEPSRFFPPLTRDFILREEYLRLEEILNSTESAKWVNKQAGKRARCSFSLDYKVSGQPGSGKTTLLKYLLMKRLVACQPTVYRVNDSTCYYFDKSIRGRLMSLQQLLNVSEEKKRDLWILTDEALKDANWNKDWHGWFIVLAGSLKKVETSNEWAKGRNPDETYINNWTWDEIYAAFTLSLEDRSPSTEQIQRLYTTFICLGPVARTCLETIPATLSTREYNKSFINYIHKMDNYMASISAKFKIGTPENASRCMETHKIIRMEPCNDNTSYTSEIMTRWIMYRIVTFAESGAKERGYKVFQTLCQQPILRPSAGWFFELYAHEWLGKGGNFQADRIAPRDSREKLSFEIKYTSSVEPYYYSSLSKVGTSITKTSNRTKSVRPQYFGRYFRPRCLTQASFDSFLVANENTLILFQITIAMKHDIKVDGVRAIVQALPQTITNIFIVFIIPELHADKYKVPQKAPTSRYLKSDTKKPKYSIKQFRLVFPNDELLSVAVLKPNLP